MHRILLGAARVSLAGFVASAAVFGGVGSSLADQKKGAACASGLPANARAIYDAAAKEAASAADLRSLIESKTRSLVMSGGLARSEARGAAESAGECLKLLRAS